MRIRTIARLSLVLVPGLLVGACASTGTTSTDTTRTDATIDESTPTAEAPHAGRTCPTCGRADLKFPAGWTFEESDWSPYVPGANSPFAPIPSEPPEELSEDEALAKVRVLDGPAELLRKIAVPDDHIYYGAFRNYGRWTGASYSGHEDLPPGHWVYVYPHWYVWAAGATSDANER